MSEAKPPAPLEVSDGRTCADHRVHEATIAQKLKAKFKPTISKSRVEVSFDCDPLTSSIDQVVFELGSGHGGGLTLWRLTRIESGKEYEALGIRYNAGGYVRVEQSRHLTIARGTVSASAVQKALALARPALTAIIREIEPPPIPNGIHGRSMFMSSGNFAHYVRIRDESKHQIEKSFAGYPGSSGQRDYLGLEIAIGEISPLVDKIEFGPETPKDEERSFFTATFVGAQARLKAPFAWWVHDRYMKLAARIGTPALLPTVVADLRDNLEAKADDEKSKAERGLENDLEVIAKLTGWDPSKDETGAKRPLVEVAREVLDECERALGEQPGR